MDEFNKNGKYDHPEAFCLMNYNCDTCNDMEQLWNSRDGVTPFIISCGRCLSGTKSHVAFHMDRCVPDYKLKPGQRYFDDGGIEDACAIIEKRYQRSKGHELAMSKETRDKLMQDVKNGTSTEFRDGWPIVRTAPEDVEKEPPAMVIVLHPGETTDAIRALTRYIQDCPDLKLGFIGDTQELDTMPREQLEAIEKEYEAQAKTVRLSRKMAAAPIGIVNHNIDIVEPVFDDEGQGPGKRVPTKKRRHKSKGRNRRQW